MSNPNYISSERFDEIAKPFADLVPGVGIDDVFNILVDNGKIFISVGQTKNTPSGAVMPYTATYVIHINKDANDDDRSSEA